MIRLVIPEIDDDEIQAVTKVLRSGYLVQGEQVLEFERSVAAFTGTSHAVAVSSGTAALHLACLVANLGPGDEVLVPDFTFPATANTVALTGAKPVLVDIDPETFNMDPDDAARKITGKSKAIIPVHLFGLPSDMDPLLNLASDHQLLVIEDAACALGASYKNRLCGSMGDMACFSFHPRKAITTGEGGMVTTANAELARHLRSLRNHGMESIDGKNQFTRIGYNYRMTDFQGALGKCQMKRLDDVIQKRQLLAAMYSQIIPPSLPIRLPHAYPGAFHIWQSYVIVVDPQIDRDRLIVELKQRGVETTIGTYSLSAQPVYSDAPGSFPHSRQAYEKGICLPLHTSMTQEDIQFVAQAIEELLSES